MTDAPEHFVGESETKSIVGNVFLSVGLMVAAVLLAIGFFWAYKTDVSYVVVLVAVLMFAYAVNVTAYIAVIREKLSVTAFRYYMGVSVFAAFLNLIVAIVFVMRQSSGPSPSPAYGRSPTPYRGPSTSGMMSMQQQQQ